MGFARPMALAVLLASLVSSPGGHAQTAATVVEGTLPVLQRQVAAPYPPQALAQRLEARVLLEIAVGADGEVESVEVIEPAGHGFDEAAAQAAQSFHFQPARDAQGHPVASRIQYAYRFSLTAVPTVCIEGQVLQAGDRTPVAHAQVVVSRDDAAPIGVRTDDAGTFRFVDLAPGEWQIDAVSPGFKPEGAHVIVAKDKVGTATLYLTPTRPWEASGVNEELEVIGYRLPPEVSERDLSRDEILMLPGTGGDVVRAVQNLPGVARTAFNAGQIMVRGTSPEDSGFMLGGSNIPIVFHFGGISTVISADSLDEVGFMPGGYGVRYGRALGGVIDLRTQRELPRRTRSYLSVDLFQSSAFTERKVSEHTAVSLSARRSYIDTLLSPWVNQTTSVQVRLPRYWDAQARVLHRADDGSTWDMMLLSSDDRFTVGELKSNGEVTESKLTTHFDKLWVQRNAILDDGWVAETTAQVGPERKEVLFRGDDEAWQKAWRGTLRAELARDVPEGGVLGWRIGMDTQVFRELFLYNVDDVGGVLLYDTDELGEAVGVLPGFYLEQTQQGARVQATPGVRVDGMWLNNGYISTAVDPRLGLSFDLDDTTSLTASAGQYSQFPELRELLTTSDGNPKLGPERSVQTTIGVKRDLTPWLSAESTAYWSWLSDLIVGHEDRFELSLEPPPGAPLDLGSYANAGSGQSRGVELLLRANSERTVAWLGGAWTHSERTPRGSDTAYLFKHDQPVQLTALTSHRLPKGWRTGARLRYGTGDPYTPVANRLLDLESGGLVPIYGEAMSSRMPAWFSLDLRVDKDWIFHKWTLSTYLDLQNATNRRNVEMVTWSTDWTEELPIYGLPLIPAFGLKGAW